MPRRSGRKKCFPICVHLNEYDVRALDAEADRLNLSRSEVVGLALTAWLAEQHICGSGGKSTPPRKPNLTFVREPAAGPAEPQPNVLQQRGTMP